MSDTASTPAGAMFADVPYSKRPIALVTRWNAFLDVFCVLVLLIGMSYASTPDGVETARLLQFGAALVSVSIAMVRWLWQRAETSAEASTDMLVLLAVIGALVSGEYAAAVIVPLVMNLGHAVEESCIQGTEEAISGLRRLSARSACVLVDGCEQTVPPDRITPGQTLVVRSGEIVAADGCVISGCSAIDEAMITGESTPRDVKPGDDVFAGAMNMNGALKIRVDRVGSHTSLGQIGAMLQSAARSKTPTVTTVERYADLYIPAVLFASAAVFLQTHSISRVISLLIVACPCAIVLSGPAAMIAALAAAARRGILIKNARFLEALADADTIIFDKTGTLTHGRLEVVAIEPAAGCSSQELRDTALRCASHSVHPVSAAIKAKLSTTSLPDQTDNDRVIDSAGRGIEVELDGHTFRLGKLDWLSEIGIPTPTAPDHGGPIVAVGKDRQCLGYLLLADMVRSEAALSLEELRHEGISRILMVTGDHLSSAQAVGVNLSLDEIHANALPRSKYEIVVSEVAAGRKVIVIGDGVNDSLALAAGNVGIAMGARGSDVAVQSADVALLSNDLCCVSDAVRLSRKTRNTIHVNLAIGITSTGCMLALGGFGWLSPLAGAVLHNIGTVIVLANSSRLLGFSRKYVG